MIAYYGKLQENRQSKVTGLQLVETILKNHIPHAPRNVFENKNNCIKINIREELNKREQAIVMQSL